MRDPGQASGCIVEVAIESGWLVGFETESDHGARRLHCKIALGSSGYNVAFKPSVLKTGDGGERTGAADRVSGVKYFLDGIEYDTLMIGEPDEFALDDLGYGGKTITLAVELTDGTIVSYSLTYEITIVMP